MHESMCVKINSSAKNVFTSSILVCIFNNRRDKILEGEKEACTAELNDSICHATIRYH